MDLRDYLHFQRISVTEFAQMLGCSRTHLSEIIHGKRIPGKWLAKDIERATNGEVKAEELLKKSK